MRKEYASQSQVYFCRMSIFGKQRIGRGYETDAGSSFILTGASKGIGREMAKVFSSEGAKLVLVARDENALKELSMNWETRSLSWPM